MRVWFPLAAMGVSCVTTLLGADVCYAQTEPVALDWQAPENCPQQGEVQQQLRALLGPLIREESVNPLRVRGSIEPLGERYRLTLRMERSATHGTRVIESDDCRSLGKAAAVVLGLLVQKEKSLGRELSTNELNGQPEPAANPGDTNSSPPSKPPPQVNRPESITPARAPEPPRRWHVLLRMPQASVDFLTLPKTSYGLGVGLGLQINSWRAMITGTLFETQSDLTPDLQPFTATYRRKALDASGCFGFRSGLVEAAPCALFAGELLQARASGDQLAARDRSFFLFSAGAGISGYLHLHRLLAIVATGSARWITTQAEFQVNALTRTEQAHSVPAISFGTSLGCEWIF